MLDLVYTNKFKKDLKRMDKRGKSRKKLADIIIKLQQQEQEVTQTYFNIYFKGFHCLGMAKYYEKRRGE